MDFVQTGIQCLTEKSMQGRGPGGRKKRFDRRISEKIGVAGYSRPALSYNGQPKDKII